MASADLTRLYAHEMADGLRAGDYTARDLVTVHRERAERQNRALNAWLCFNDTAFDEADAEYRRALERGRR